MTRAPLRAQRPMDFAVSHLPPRRLRYQKRGTSSHKDFWLIVAFQGAKMRQKSGPVNPSAEKVVNGSSYISADLAKWLDGRTWSIPAARLIIR